MNRRAFLTGAGSALLLNAQNKAVGGWQITQDTDGNIQSLRNAAGTELIASDAKRNAPSVSGPATLTSEVRLVEIPNGVVLEQKITTRRTATFGKVLVNVPRPLRLPGSLTTFAPTKDGVGRRLQGRAPCAYEFCGLHAVNDPIHLAIPMVSETNGSLRMTVSADPSFTVGFAPESIHWIHPDTVPLPEQETRTIYTAIHSRDERSAMDVFYATALASVKKGPDWLHDVAMVDYDFLSKNGRGWFADIDVLERMVDRRDRHKVLLALHGWYDFCGRYSFDSKSKSLDKRWTAFPNALAPEFQKLAERKDTGNAFYWPPASIRAMRPVEMTLASMHDRIRYAKSRGFRVGLYFADGLNSCDALADYDPEKVLRTGGWTGPETRGNSYALNPLHPEVPAFFLSYLSALLQEYGREVDAFVWDETFHAQAEDLGTPRHPGHAGRAMMQLVKDLTAQTGGYRADLAFLASDDIGLIARYQAPYALVAHGTYQDSSCAPKGWPYGLFSNFRNTLWSCNWAPMKAFERTEYAANVFDVPVAISNGYAEDLGVSDMNTSQLRKVADLFNRRKNRRMEIGWIEEAAQGRTYLGRAI